MDSNNRLKIFQVYFDEKQVNKLDDRCVHFFNKEKAEPFFENEILVRLYNECQLKGCDYFGLISFRFKEKCFITPSEYIEFVEKETPDVALIKCFKDNDALYDRPLLRNMLHQTDIGYGIKLLYQNDIIPFKNNDWNTVTQFCNFQIARTEMYVFYIRNFLIPAIEFIKTNEFFQTTTFVYRKQLYSIIPFVLEYLFGLYVYHFKLNYKYIENDKLKSKYKYIPYDLSNTPPVKRINFSQRGGALL